MKHSLVTVLFTAMVFCCRANSNAETTDDHVNNIIVVAPMAGSDMKAIDTLSKNAVLFCSVNLRNNIMHFFGKELIMDEPLHIKQQIEEIVAMDSMLSVERRVLNIGNVGFGINIHDSELLLISSTPVDDPKIEQVVDYLSSIYGVPEEMEPYHYWWQIKDDYENPSGLVRLRSLRGSEDGGTVILITP